MPEKISRKFHRLFLIIFILFILNSIFFQIHEADHECSGEECPVCQIMQIAAQNIKLINLESIDEVFSSYKLPNFFIKQNSPFKNIFFISKSPVSQKVRINE